MMRRAIGLATLLLAACEVAPPDATPRAPGDVGADSAFFMAFPEELFEQTARICQGPGEELIRPDRNTIRCEILADPVAAAGLILEFDGTVTDLPVFVLSFQVTQRQGGYVVRSDRFIEVPREGRRAVQVRLDDQRMSRQMRGLLRGLGGVPLG